jgi:hypothetical protein
LDNEVEGDGDDDSNTDVDSRYCGMEPATRNDDIGDVTAIVFERGSSFDLDDAPVANTRFGSTLPTLPPQRCCDNSTIQLCFSVSLLQQMM